MKLSAGEFKESRFAAEGSLVLRGETVKYRVVSEDNLFCEDAGKPLGSMFSYSYFREGGGTSAQRPVVFVYNGGPGSSCVWLHLGFFAPRRVRLADPLNPPVLPPFELEDNPHSPLDVCDIVLVDPVETGYGRLLDPEAGKKFFGIEADASAFTQFIEGWLTKYRRWGSKVYLAGESYGAIRSCVLVNSLMGGPTAQVERMVGISVAGILFLGSYFPKNGYMTPESVEPAVLQLPGVAAANWYHHPAGKPDLESFVEEAYRFSYETYLPALFLGGQLCEKEFEQVAGRLAYFSGLPASYLKEHQLRISADSFAARLLKEEGITLGLYDSRYKLKNAVESGLQDPVGDDSAMGQYSPAFLGAMAGPLKEELKITFEREYKAINFSINRGWENDLKQTPLQYLLAALRRSRELRVLFGQGYWDLVCPLGQIRYAVSHMHMPAERVQVALYPSGHMPYLGEDSAAKLAGDVRAFMR
jgi:carboxypeptidase C (cathepsin A)